MQTDALCSRDPMGARVDASLDVSGETDRYSFTLIDDLLIDKPTDLPGRCLRKGEIVGYVRTADPPLVHVRFEHAAEPVAQRIGRAPRRAFLSQLQI